MRMPVPLPYRIPRWSVEPLRSLFYMGLSLAMVCGFLHEGMAQEPTCGTPTLDSLTEWDRSFAREAQSRAHKVTGIVRTIPVVVHVIYADSTDASNISTEQITSQFTVLNDDFRGRNGGVDTEVEFCLAGIYRTAHMTLGNAGSGNNRKLKELTHEDSHRFLNCWVVNSINDGDWFGLSSFPKDFATEPELDGVVIAHDCFGITGTARKNTPHHLGKIATHEFGHWLGLYHVFQGRCEDAADCAEEGDGCCDTPPQWRALRRCEARNTCHKDVPDLDDPLENYMGYADDKCMTTFTECQRGRIQHTLDAIRTQAWFLDGPCPSLDRGFRSVLYPNPPSGPLQVGVEIIGKDTPLTISLLDSQGRLIQTVCDHTTLQPGQHSFAITLPQRGFFLVRVTSPWNSHVHKALAW